MISGSADNDELFGGTGTDTLDGGVGFDVAQCDDAASQASLLAFRQGWDRSAKQLATSMLRSKELVGSTSPIRCWR